MTAFERTIQTSNEQLSPRGVTLAHTTRLASAKPDSVIILGMGGSGLAGEIIAALKDELRISVPVEIWKSYGIPKTTHKRPFTIAVSFSGDTEETLSGFAEARKAKRGTVAIVTSGGELKEQAERLKLPAAFFDPGDLTPRQSTGIMFYSLTELLRLAGLVRSVPTFSHLTPSIFRSRGTTIARALKGRVIAVYASAANHHLAYIWKIKCNETAKTLAFADVLPEMNHNELVGYDAPGKTRRGIPVVALFLEDSADHPRIAKRMRLTQRLLRERGVRIISIHLTGKTRLEKTWNSIMLADWTSFSLAKLEGVEPEETEVIVRLKNAMKR